MKIIVDRGAYIPTRAHEADAGLDLYAPCNSDEPYTVRMGDKITQLVILPIYAPELELVETFEETERGSSGFGSTGR